MKAWQCSVCKYIHQGSRPPGKCPVCRVDARRFIEIDEASIPENKLKRNPAKKIETQVKPQAPPPAKTTFEKIQSLLIKHHAHPVSVHTPNGILPAIVILWILAWIFDSDFLAKIAGVNMIFVVISLPFVIFTGILEWKNKYNGAMTLVFKLKILAASLTTASCIINLIWYLLDPNILSSPKAWVFILMTLFMLTAVGVSGHIGGKLVFKD
ncbi:MAG: rubredoxin [Desulfobacteraceae bacterium]|nr:rubredoxin [Desulfobacteraceae bacterium]